MDDEASNATPPNLELEQVPPARVGLPDILERTRLLIEAPLRAAIETLNPHLVVAARYHMGWVRADGTAIDSTGLAGKGMRSSMAVLGAEAVGACSEDAIPGAVAIELIHNFSLIHDDIMDNDRMRRGRRTVWDVFGIGHAIIVGDSLHSLAMQTLLGNANQRQVEATRRLVNASVDMIAGQAQDVALDQAFEFTLAQCEQMETDKTGALLAESIAIGAVLGGGSEQQIKALHRFGLELGIAFQMIDDVLGIWGDPKITGKPVGNDLRQRKKSIPMALGFQGDALLAKAMTAAFASQPTLDQVQDLTRKLTEAGIRDQTEQLAQSHLDEALEALDSASLDAPAVTELRDLATFVGDRIA